MRFWPGSIYKCPKAVTWLHVWKYATVLVNTIWWDHQLLTQGWESSLNMTWHNNTTVTISVPLFHRHYSMKSWINLTCKNATWLLVVIILLQNGYLISSSYSHTFTPQGDKQGYPSLQFFWTPIITPFLFNLTQTFTKFKGKRTRRKGMTSR